MFTYLTPAWLIALGRLAPTGSSIPFLVLLTPMYVWSDTAENPAPPSADKLAQLIRQLGDDCFQVREEASKQLEGFGLVALPALEEATESTDPEVQHRAWRIIDHWASEGRVPALLFQLSSGSAPIRAGAADSLGRMEAKAQQALPQLLRAAGDETELVRCSAQEAIKRIQSTLPVRVEAKFSPESLDLETTAVCRIEIANHGKDAVTGVRLTAVVPEPVEVVAVEGSLSHQREGNKLASETITLQANESRNIEIHVRPKAAGQVRVRVEVTGEGLPAPVIGETVLVITQPAPKNN